MAKETKLFHQSLMWPLVLYLLAVAVIVAKKIHYEDCGSTRARITTMELEPCDNVSYCSLNRGTAPKVWITFVPERQVTRLSVMLIAVIRGHQILLPTGERNACRNSGLSCPLKANEPVTFYRQLKVEKFYPKVSLELRGKLVDQEFKPLICASINTHVV